MPSQPSPDDLYHQIIHTYLKTESVQDTAHALNVSVVKVRRVLITEGLWTSRSSQMINHLYQQNKTVREIAEELHITEKNVQAYIPYSKGMYGKEEKTDDARYSAVYRKRLQLLRENVLRKDTCYAAEGGWDTMKPFNETEMNYYSEKDFKNWKKIHKTDSFEVLRLHLVLTNSYDDAWDEDDLRVLRSYGGVRYEDGITRDILVPTDMPLYALNYAIQKAFGFQNCHLHCFKLPDHRFDEITGGTAGGFEKLMGIVFRSPYMDESDMFWTDDYEDDMNFKTWLKNKYTGPYLSLCHGEGVFSCRQDARRMLKRIPSTLVNWYIRENGEKMYTYPTDLYDFYGKRLPEPIEVKETSWGGDKLYHEEMPFSEIPIRALSFMYESSLNQLLERLPIGDILAITDQDGVSSQYSKSVEEVLKYSTDFFRQGLDEIDSPTVQPFTGKITDEIDYEYDFGDGWMIKITARPNCDDLINSKRLSMEELDQAARTVLEEHRPACVGQDGYRVMDDVGGTSGYINFLRSVNEVDEYLYYRKLKGDALEPEEIEEYLDFEQYTDRNSSLEWASMWGWSKRRTSNKNLL